MLKLTDVYKTFNPGTVNEKKALCGVNLTLNDGDFVTVIGGNGAGKSTVLNAIAGVWSIDAGSIVIDDTDITRLSEHQRAKYIWARLPGPHDRHGCQHGDSGESCHRGAPR